MKYLIITLSSEYSDHAQELQKTYGTAVAEYFEWWGFPWPRVGAE